MKWDNDKTHGVMWIAAEAAKSLLGSMKKETGTCFTENLCYCHDNNFEWCTLEEENIKIGNFLVKKFKDDSFAGKFIKDYRRFLVWNIGVYFLGFISAPLSQLVYNFVVCDAHDPGSRLGSPFKAFGTAPHLHHYFIQYFSSINRVF